MFENISHQSKKYQSKIELITSHLKTKLGITYFAKQRVTNKGEWDIIANNPEWLDHSAGKLFFLRDPSLIHPDNYESGLAYISSNCAPDCIKELTFDCRHLFSMDHTLCIFQKNNLGGDWYFLASDSNNHKAPTTYLSQIKVIYQFIQFFNEEAKTLLNKNNDFKINLEQLKQVPFTTPSEQLYLMPYSDSDIDIKWPQDIHFSPREKDCIHCLLQGKTIKETARVLGISPRTVEDYINSLKTKMNCQYKRELIALFKQAS